MIHDDLFEEWQFNKWEGELLETLKKNNIKIHPWYIVQAVYKMSANELNSLIANKEYFLDDYIRDIFILIDYNFDFHDCLKIIWLDKMVSEMVNPEQFPTAVLLYEGIITKERVFEALALEKENNLIKAYKEKIGFINKDEKGWYV